MSAIIAERSTDSPVKLNGFHQDRAPWTPRYTSQMREAIQTDSSNNIQVPNSNSDVITDGLAPTNLSLSLEQLSKITNPSLTVTPTHTLHLRHMPIPQLTQESVLLHIQATGICGSDLHLWRRGTLGSPTLTVHAPCTLGHEAAGTILAIGPAAQQTHPHLRVGDRVSIEPGVPCETCFLCRSGRYNLCEDVRFAGVFPYEGTCRRFMCHPAQWVHKLPENVTFAQGALLEPLSVVLHALEAGRVQIGRPVAICGAGPIGLIALAAVRASGAWPIVITDVGEKRLEFARELVEGCLTYRVRTELGARENADAIRELIGLGKRDERGVSEDEYDAPAVVLECTGVENSVATAAYTCRRGGTVVAVGVGKATMNNLPFMHLSLAEIELKFINRYHDTWPAGIRALSGGILNLDKLVTHTFPLERAVEAMELAGDISKGSVKVQVVDNVDLRSIVSR